MPRFCANISMLYAELPLIERIGAARMAGFEAIEILFPYDGDAGQLRDAIRTHDLALALINCPPPNYSDPAGPRGMAAVPEEVGRFRMALRRSLRYAAQLGAERVHIMSGVAEGPEAELCLIENLRHAVAETDRPLTIEPLNRHDMPGYFLSDFDTALRVIDAVGSDRLGLQFDIYHAARITGDVLGAWDRVKTRVTHVQFADLPGRGAPGTGQLDLPAIFARLDADGYSGWVSAEYLPGKDTRKTLDWLRW